MENRKLRKVRKKRQISDSSSEECDKYSNPTGGLPLPPSSAFKDTDADYADMDIAKTMNIVPVLQHSEQKENASVGGIILWYYEF